MPVEAYTLPPHLEQFRPKLQDWADLIRDGRINRFRESEILLSAEDYDISKATVALSPPMPT